MTSGLSTGSLPSLSLRPNETCTPSKPSCLASGTDCGSAARWRFQSVTPMRSLFLAAKATPPARGAAAKLRRRRRRVRQDTGAIVVLSRGQREYQRFHGYPIILVAFTELFICLINQRDGFGQMGGRENSGCGNDLLGAL